MVLDSQDCKKCGGDLRKISDTEYECCFCGSKFHVESRAEASKPGIDDKTREKLKVAKKELWDRTHDKYIDSDVILKLCSEILDIEPDDFYAQFFSVAALDPSVEYNEDKLCKFMTEIDTNAQYEVMDSILDYLLKSITEKIMLAISDLIERTYKNKDISLYNAFRTRYDLEAEKVLNNVYDPTLPRSVFISYSSKDMETVKAVCNYLESKNISCFVALRNMQHGNGAKHNYWDVIHTAIDHCKTLVFISSKHSRTSEKACNAVSELIYIRDTQNRRKNPMRMIEYVIEPYSNGGLEAITDETIKEFFENGATYDNLDDIYQNEFERDPNMSNVRANAAAPKKEEEYDDEILALCDCNFPRDVFVAYADEDVEKADELVAALESERLGLTCFISHRNTQTWNRNDQNEIDRNYESVIDNCKAFVLVSSTHSRTYKCRSKKAIDYINKSDANRKTPIKRIEYVIESYQNGPVDPFYRAFFANLEWALDIEAVVKRLLASDDKKKKESQKSIDFSKEYDVFVSYSNSDYVKVKELVSFLESNGMSCFFKDRDYTLEADESYNDNIHKIIDNCESVVFVSSNNSRSVECASKKELEYITKTDRNRFSPMKKVEYLIEPYRGQLSDKLFQRFFINNDSCVNFESVYDRLLGFQYDDGADLLMESSAAAKDNKNDIKNIEEKEVKYCKFCGTENPLNTKFCCECGQMAFVSTREEYVKLRIESQRELEKIKEKEQREKETGTKNSTLIYANEYGRETNSRHSESNRRDVSFGGGSDSHNSRSSSRDVSFGGGHSSSTSNRSNDAPEVNFDPRNKAGQNHNKKPEMHDNHHNSNGDYSFSSASASTSQSSSRSNMNSRLHVPQKTEVLQIGQRVVIDDNVNVLSIICSVEYNVGGVSANTFIFMLDDNGKTQSDNDLIFFNNPTSVNNSIKMVSSTDKNEVFDINLSRIPNDVSKVSFVNFILSENNRPVNFSMIKKLTITARIGSTDYVYDVNNAGKSKSIYSFELYKYKMNWKLKVVGLPSAKQANSICEEYGIKVF